MAKSTSSSSSTNPFETTNLKGGTYTTSIYNPIGGGGGRSSSSGSSSTSDTLLSNAVSGVLGLKETAATDTANAAAQKAAATGYTAEQTAYGNVSTLAVNNAYLARAAGDVLNYQDLLKAKETIGSQQQGLASSGLRKSGSSLDLLRSSLQQSYLNQQVNETQTAINVGGYLAQSAAATGEASAAGAATSSATALAGSYTTAATLATTNAANETKALDTYLSGKTLTAADKLLISPLTADLNVPTTISNQTTLDTGTTSTAKGIGSSSGKIL